MKLPRPSDLRHRITVQRRSEMTPDGYGNTLSTWAPLLTGVPAKIGPQKGGENVQEARVAGLAPFEVIIRSTASTRALTTADRLVDERSGQTFAISWIGNLDERDRFLWIIAQSGGADG
jgi:hypothetical protein